jgi:hypothetical protein
MAQVVRREQVSTSSGIELGEGPPLVVLSLNVSQLLKFRGKKAKVQGIRIDKTEDGFIVQVKWLSAIISSN